MNSFDRDARIGTAEEACRLYAILVGGIVDGRWLMVQTDEIDFLNLQRDF